MLGSGVFILSIPFGSFENSVRQIFGRKRRGSSQDKYRSPETWLRNMIEKKHDLQNFIL
jgi:hypothetical protein